MENSSWFYYVLSLVIAFFAFGGFGLFKRKGRMMSLEDASRIDTIHDEIMENKGNKASLKLERKQLYKKYENRSPKI